MCGWMDGLFMFFARGGFFEFIIFFSFCIYSSHAHLNPVQKKAASSEDGTAPALIRQVCPTPRHLYRDDSLMIDWGDSCASDIGGDERMHW